MRYIILILSFLHLLFITPLLSTAQNEKKAIRSGENSAAPVGFIIKKTTEEGKDIINPPAGTAIYNSAIEKIEYFAGKACRNPAANEHYIGKVFEGGIILYLDSTKQYGLIVAPHDQSTAAQWGFLRNRLGPKIKR